MSRPNEPKEREGNARDVKESMHPGQAAKKGRPAV